MSGLAAARNQETAPTLVRLAGDADLASHEDFCARLANALEFAAPIVVDLGDCTYVDVETVKALSDASHRARQGGFGFVVVLPYSAETIVRRMLLELAPELVTFAIAPTLTSAVASALRSSGATVTARLEPEDIQVLRATIWENGARLAALQREHDGLRLEQRRILQLARERRRS